VFLIGILKVTYSSFYKAFSLVVLSSGRIFKTGDDLFGKRLGVGSKISPFGSFIFTGYGYFIRCPLFESNLSEKLA